MRFAACARGLSGVAARTLGWRPDDFWNATPTELAAILHDDPEQAGASLGRAELDALMERERNG